MILKIPCQEACVAGVKSSEIYLLPPPLLTPENPKLKLEMIYAYIVSLGTQDGQEARSLSVNKCLTRQPPQAEA